MAEMEEIDENVEEEFDDEALDDEEETVIEAEPTPPAEPDESDVESIEDILAKKEELRAGEEDESLLNIGHEERLEPLAVKVVPQQATEFVCKRCYLVKHRSQLKDKKRMLCRDCA
jgi:hypothetical protein